MKKKELFRGKYIQRIIFSLMLTISCLSANSQNRISLNFTNIPLSEAIKKIEASSKYTFFFDAEKTDVNQKVSVDIENQTIESIMTNMLKNTNLTFDIENYQIALILRKQVADRPKRKIAGIITEKCNDLDRQYQYGYGE